MDSHARLHAELTGFLRQHCPAADERHLTLLGWMVAGLLLSQTVCFGHWQRALPMVHCLAASWQRRCRRWLGNERIDVQSLYGPLVLWAIQHWPKPGHSLHLALDTTVLWNRFCVVVLSLVCHGRAIPLLWQTLEHPSAELLGWFEGRERWSYVMRLRGDAEIHGTAAPLGCQVHRLRLSRGHCRGFRDVPSSSVSMPWRWHWKVAEGQRSSTPTRAVNSRLATTWPGCRQRGSRSAGRGGTAATTISWWNGCGAQSSARRCTCTPTAMVGRLRSAFPASCGGTAM